MNPNRKYPSISILFWPEEGLLGRQRAAGNAETATAKHHKSDMDTIL